MNQHLKFKYRIMTAEDGVDKETLEHCRQCHSCRMALYRKFCQPEKTLPFWLDQTTLNRCRVIKPWRLVSIKKRFAYSAVAVFLLCCAVGLFLVHGNRSEVLPEQPQTDADQTIQAMQLDSTDKELFLELSEVRLALNAISQELSETLGHTAE